MTPSQLPDDIIRPPQPDAKAVSTPDLSQRHALLHFVLRQARLKTHGGSRQTVTQGYELLRRTLPHYNIIHILRGHVTWVLDKTPCPLVAGQMVFVPPNTPHHAGDSSRRMDLISIHIEMTLPGGQDVFTLLTPPITQHVPPKSRLEQYLHGYASEYRRRDSFMTALTMPGWGRLLGTELLWHSARLNLLTQHPIEPLIPQILAELQNHIASDITLDELAAWAGYSPQHLNRVFRKVLGVTPLQHLTRMRLEKAADLLADDTLTVAAIAQAVGIEDPYYFSRLFKQHYRQSPANYRQSLDAR